MRIRIHNTAGNYSYTFLNGKKADPDPNTHFLAMFWVRIWTGLEFNWVCGFGSRKAKLTYKK
jgi:hypothetical protein